MDHVAPDTLLAALEWRYSARRFDSSRRIPEATWSALERSLVLTPSSWGLQPWRFVVVDDPAVRERLVGASFGQRQVAESARLVVFAARRGLGPADVERHVRRFAEVRGVPAESLERMRASLVRFVSQPRDRLDLDEWCVRQVYIALGNFLTSAALLGVDTSPMEGIEPARYDEILGLAAQGYTAVVACCAGHRAADDPAAGKTKVRFALPEVVVRA